MKKLIALLMAMALCVTMLAACETTDPGAAPAPQEETADGDYADYSGGFEERVTIQIPVYDRAFEGWDVTDNYYTRWAQEEFGEKYNVNVEYVAIGRSTEVQDYMQLLSAGNAPTIIMHYDFPQAIAYYSEGVLQNLDWNELQHYAPTIWEYTGSSVQTYGTINGDQAFFFAERPEADNFTNIIRKDWVEAAGYAVEDLTSVETFNEMLLKWKELGLGKMTRRNLMNNYTYSYPYQDYPMDPVEHALYIDLNVADLTSKGSEAFLRNLNYQFNEGILDPEFYMRLDETQEKAEFVAGRTGVLMNYLASNTDIMSSTLANDPEAEFAILPNGAQVPEGNVFFARRYYPFGMIMGINYEATDEERIATWMYLEWMSQPENFMKWQNGVEGETYNLDETGLAVRVGGYTGESAQSANNNKDYWCLVCEGQRYEDQDLFWAANKQAWAPPGYESLADDIIREYLAAAEWRVPEAMYTVVIESANEYRADLNTLFQQLYVQIVTGSIEDFDANYAAACEEYLAAGYQEILDEKQEAIDAGNVIFGFQ